MAEKRSTRVKETHNGVKKEGDWDEITEFAEDVKEAMEEVDVQDESIENFEEWRPRKEDEKEDVKEKTVKAATHPEKKIEEKSDGVKKDMEKASKNIAKAGEKVKKNENPNDELKDASKEVARPFFSKAAKTLRKFEEKIYSRLMLPLNDYYFDTGDVAVDVRDRSDGNYQMDVKVTEEDKREDIKEEMRDRE